MKHSRKLYKNLKKKREEELDVLEYYGEETDRALEKNQFRRKGKRNDVQEIEEAAIYRFQKSKAEKHFQHRLKCSDTFNNNYSFDESHENNFEKKFKKKIKHKRTEEQTIVCQAVSFKNYRCA